MNKKIELARKSAQLLEEFSSSLKIMMEHQKKAIKIGKEIVYVAEKIKKLEDDASMIEELKRISYEKGYKEGEENAYYDAYN